MHQLRSVLVVARRPAMTGRILACFAAAAVGGLAMAPAALASISITSASAQLQVVDQACVNSLAVCDNHVDPPISSGTGTGPMTFDHTVTQPHVTASAGGDEAHADASGHYAVSLTGGGATDLVITTAGTLSASAGVTAVSGHQNFAAGNAGAQTNVRFTLDAAVPYHFAGTASVSGTNLVPVTLARDDGTGTRVFSMSQTGQVDGSPTGTLAPGKYIYIDFGSAIASDSSSSHGAGSASDTWSAKLTLTAGACDDISVGHAVAQGCFTETAPGSGVFTTDATAWVGGFEIRPRPGGKLVIDTHAPSVGQQDAGVDVVFAGFAVPLPVSLLPVNATDATVDLNQAGTLEKVLLSLPLKGKAKVAWASDGKSSSFSAELSVEKLTNKLGALVTLRTDESVGELEAKLSAKLVNGQGFVPQQGEVKIDEINVIPSVLHVQKTLKLTNLLLRFELKDGKPFWTGAGQIVLPLSRGDLGVGGKIFAFDGALAGGGLSVDGINKEIPDTPLFLQKVEGDLVFAPHFGFNLGVGATLGPRLEGKQLLTIDGTMAGGTLVSSTDCRSGLDPNKLEFKAKFTPLDKLVAEGLAKTEFTGRSCVYTGTDPAQELTGQVKIELGKVLGYEASQTGFVSKHGLNLEGAALVRLPGLPDLNGQAIVSTRGLAACANVNFFQGGFGYRWGDRVPSTFTGCDLTPFRVTAAARAAASATARTVRVPAGLPFAAFAAGSPGGAPRVKVSGPGGVSVSSPAGDHALRSATAVVVPVAAEHTTYVFVKHPRAGSWRVQSLDGSALSKVAVARGLPRPHVTARVTGKGARRTLSYLVKPLPGQQVRFTERGEGVAHELGRARGRRGRIAFNTTVARDRRRTIQAEVIQNGLPRADLAVARFTAPARPKLTKPKLTAKRTKTALTLSWKPVPGATNYLVEVRNGATVLQRLLTRRHKVTFNGTPATGALTVRVRALGASVPPGPVTKAVYGRK